MASVEIQLLEATRVLRNMAIEERAKLLPAVRFAFEVIRDTLNEDGFALDGADLQDLAEKVGLIKAAIYDPDIHGPSDCEAGDPWYLIQDFELLREIADK